MTLANTLNELNASVTYEGNRAYVLDAEANELPQQVGDFYLSASNTGLDCWPENGLWWVKTADGNEAAGYHEESDSWHDNEEKDSSPVRPAFRSEFVPNHHECNNVCDSAEKKDWEKALRWLNDAQQGLEYADTCDNYNEAKDYLTALAKQADYDLVFPDWLS